MDLSVITVTWNSGEKIERQMQSVALACQAISWEQIVVDNNSADNTVSAVQKFPGVKLIINQENKGFGAANNQAWREAVGRYILFLNPDMRAEAGSFDKLVRFMDTHPAAGIVGCKLVTEAGELNPATTPRRFPTLFNQMVIVSKLHHFFPQLLDKYRFADFDAGRELAVSSVQGSFMLVRRELLNKLGWAFDPRYFIWFEDVDLCREAKRLGYKVIYTPSVSCVDYAGDSFKKRSTWWKQKQFIKSMVKYFIKWGI